MRQRMTPAGKSLVTAGALALALSWTGGAAAQTAQMIQDALQIDLIEVDGHSGILNRDRFANTPMARDERRLTNIADCPLYNRETGEGAECDTSARGYELEITWSAPGLTFFDYSQWSAKIGQCSSAALNDDSESCRRLRPAGNIVSGANTFRVELATLIGTLEPTQTEATGGVTRACCSELLGRNIEVRVYLFFGFDSSSTDGVALVEIPFRYDYLRPNPPTEVETSSQGQTILVEWTKVVGEDEDNIDYRVFWSREPFDSPDQGGVSGATVAGTRDNYVIITDGDGVFYVSVATRDEAENLSDITPNQMVETIPTSDGFQYYKQLGGAEEGGYCFVATAAYGSYLDPHVGVLRGVRDRLLLTTSWGRGLVAQYYALGGPWGAWIAERPWARSVVRVALLPVVALSWFVVEAAPLTKLALLAALALLVVGARRWMARRYDVPGALVAHGG